MKNSREENKINIRIKLSAMWTAVMFCYIYGDYFELYVPDKIAGLANGHNMLDTPIKLLIATLLLTLPALMIFLTVMLSPKLTKYLNIGIAIFFTLFTILVGSSSLSEWRMFYVFLSITESAITLLIVWHAWNWRVATTLTQDTAE